MDSLIAPDQQDYFVAHEMPDTVPAKVNLVTQFCLLHQNTPNKRIVLITSGGTTVPLEKNTVRFLDNFSLGTRGSACCEYFLRAGYACIFMYRQHSLQPFTRHVSQFLNSSSSGGDSSFTVGCPLNHMQTDGQDIRVKNVDKQVLECVEEFHKYKQSNQLLLLPFVTIQDYLFLLRDISRELGNRFGSRAMWLLAAAVSDFHIPSERMSTHKIQSANEFVLQMDQVPKVLKPLVKDWASQGFIVSFKLETDQSMVERKSLAALDRYGHQIVIANLLQSRKHLVQMFYFDNNNSTHDSGKEKRLVGEEVRIAEDSKQEIEELIVRKLNTLHTNHLLSHQ